MRAKNGSMVLVMILIVSAMALVGIIAYQYMRGSNNLMTKNYSQKGTNAVVLELTKTDEVSDIEKDLNSTNTESMDADIAGVSSLVE